MSPTHEPRIEALPGWCYWREGEVISKSHWFDFEEIYRA